MIVSIAPAGRHGHSDGRQQFWRERRGGVPAACRAGAAASAAPRQGRQLGPGRGGPGHYGDGACACGARCGEPSF